MKTFLLMVAFVLCVLAAPCVAADDTVATKKSDIRVNDTKSTMVEEEGQHVYDVYVASDEEVLENLKETMPQQ
jgi:hypothetical protein